MIFSLGIFGHPNGRKHLCPKMVLHDRAGGQYHLNQLDRDRDLLRLVNFKT